MKKLLPVSLALALAVPIGAHADTAADIAALRSEIDAIRFVYEARLQALDQRLKAAESGAGAAPAATAQAAPAALPAPAAVPPPQAANAGTNAFNPAVSLILSGLYTRTSRDPAGYAIRGFALPEGA